MFAVPSARADMMPEVAPTDTVPASEDAHVPPVGDDVSVAVAVRQRAVVPPMAPGTAFTVIILITKQPVAGIV